MTFDQVVNVLSHIVQAMVTACRIVEYVCDCKTGIALNRQVA